MLKEKNKIQKKKEKQDWDGKRKTRLGREKKNKIGTGKEKQDWDGKRKSRLRNGDGGRNEK